MSTACGDEIAPLQCPGNSGHQFSGTIGCWGIRIVLIELIFDIPHRQVDCRL